MSNQELMPYVYMGIACGIVKIEDDCTHKCSFPGNCSSCPCDPFCAHVSTIATNWAFTARQILATSYSKDNYQKFRNDYPELCI